jgi:hypothetical protein
MSDLPAHQTAVKPTKSSKSRCNLAVRGWSAIGGADLRTSLKALKSDQAVGEAKASCDGSRHSLMTAGSFASLITLALSHQWNLLALL